MAKRNRRVKALAAAPVPPAVAAPSTMWGHVLALLCIACAGIAGFGNTLDFPLVFDDVNFFAPDVFRQNSSQPIWAARWLSTATFLVPPWTGTLPPIFGWRLTNIGLHILNGVLIYALVWLLTGFERADFAPPGKRSARYVAAGFAALAFVLHPIAPYAVTYLVQRSTVLATLFSLLAMLGVARWAGTGKPGWLAGVLVCTLGAISAKPHAAPLLWALVSLAWVLAPAKLNWRGLAVAAPITVLTAVWVLVPHADLLFGGTEPYVQSLGVKPASHPYLNSVLTQCGLYFRYLIVMLVPWTGWMSIDVRISPLDLLPAGLVAGLGFFHALSASIFVQLRSKSYALVICAWALTAQAAFFTVELGTARIQEPFVLYRAYLWMAPLWVAAGVGLAVTGLPRWVWMLVVIWLGFAGWGLSDRQGTFSDAARLWTDAIRKLPERPVFMSQRAYANRGLAWLERGAYADAISDFDLALQITPNHYEALINRAAARARIGEREKTVPDLERAALLQPHLPYPFGPLCAVYSGLQRIADAERACTRAIELRPQAEFYINRGSARGTAGDTVRALADFEEAVRLSPLNGTALYNRSQALQQLGQAAAASEGLQKACSMGYMPACQALGR